MLIWVIGKKGILGSWFCRILKEKKISFIATSFDEVDLLLPNSIESFIEQKKPTHIINCAAYTDVEKAEEERDKAFLLNSFAIELLAKKASSCKIIHFSTDYVFNGEKRKSYVEDDETCPINVYGQSKQEGEKKLFALHEDALCIRISSLFGGNNDFISKIERLLLTKESLSVVKDQIICPTFAKDVVEATLLLLNVRGLFHFSSSSSCSWYDYALFLFRENKMKKHLKCEGIKPILTKDFSTKAKRPLYSVLSLSKIQTFGVKSRDWQLALEEYLDGR